jgi:D5 protein-like
MTGQTRSDVFDHIIDYQVSLRMVAECRKVHGRKAAARLWVQLGLPDAALPEVAVEPDSLDRFLSRCVKRSPGNRVKSSVLYSAFDGWCRRGGERSWTITAFGRAVKERGIKWKASQHVWFLDIEMVSDAEHET